MVRMEEFEWRDTASGDALTWRGHAWVGKDRDKAYLKTRGETNSNSTDQFEVQLLYSRAIATYWDLQVGWRRDFQPVESRDWFTLSFDGLAPGFIVSELELFAGSSGRVAARARGAYEMLITNRITLEPELEFSWFGEEDPVNGIGSGLSSMEAGLRLRYVIRREFEPYIGVVWEESFGDTRRLRESAGSRSSDVQVVAGAHFWF